VAGGEREGARAGMDCASVNAGNHKGVSASGRRPCFYNPTQFALRSSAMSIWEKLAGATAELLRSGPMGAVLGGVNGQEAGKDQLVFTVGVIALGAKMAKADGVVTRDEVNALKEVFKIPAGEMKNVANIFNMAKQDVTGYQAY